MSDLDKPITAFKEYVAIALKYLDEKNNFLFTVMIPLL